MQYGRLNVTRLLNRAKKLGILEPIDDQDYADYIHDLWQTLLTNPVLKEDAQLIDDNIGTGDAIQLLSDALHEMGLTNA